MLSRLFAGLDARVFLEDILNANNIIENGNELIHSCPLPFGMHRNGDQNPSASLNRESLLFNCFTCGGGSIIWLTQNCLSIDRADAIAVIKNEVTGLKVVPIEKFIERLESAFATPEAKSIDIPHYSENILKRWEGTCDYLTDRGVSLQVQKEMRTGVDSGRYEISRGPLGEEVLPVDRVVLPHFIKGRLAGWVARKLQPIDGVPKYRNSKGFPRGAWLYNLDNARQYKRVYLVESPMSVLVLKSRGVDNVVASFGAKVENSQIELLRNFEQVTVFMDGDDAGRRAVVHAYDRLKDYTRVHVIDTPDFDDPATLREIPESEEGFSWVLKKKIVDLNPTRSYTR